MLSKSWASWWSLVKRRCSVCAFKVTWYWVMVVLSGYDGCLDKTQSTREAPPSSGIQAALNFQNLAGLTADVSGAPIDIVFFEVEDSIVRQRRTGEVAAGGVCTWRTKRRPNRLACPCMRGAQIPPACMGL